MAKTPLNLFFLKFLQIKEWIKTHRIEFLLLLAMLVVASFMRLYRIGDYMTFLGDEGRDVVIVKRFLTQGDIMLIGPGTSIGNMYLGPLYYYMIAPALWLFNYSPIGPAIMVSVMGVATVFLVWYVTREWFGKSAALISGALYAIAPTVIIYSRSSWNPNIMPFFALLTILGIWKVWDNKKYYWLPVVGVSLAFCLQSHYLGLILVPVAAIFWFLALIDAFKTKKRKQIILHSVFMALVFLLLMSPLVIFDIRHNAMNFNALKTFFTERQTTVSIKPWKALPGMWPQLTQIVTRLVGGFDVFLGNWIALGVLSSGFFVWTKHKKATAILFVWLFVGLLGLALYKQQIYDHYYGFLFPVPFMLIAGALGTISDKYRIRGLWITIIIVILLKWANIKASPLQYEPNRQLPRSQEVAKFILKEKGSDNFNFAVIAERNYEGAYQYFLDDSPNFKIIDPQNTKDTITSQLYVVCELRPEKCDPTHNPKTEVANFGWSKIEKQTEVSGVTVFKLIHSLPKNATPSATPK